MTRTGSFEQTPDFITLGQPAKIHEGRGAQGPIGVFDSGIGGLSVLRHIRSHLPYEDMLYVADSGFAPYGSKSEAVIVARTSAIAQFLLQRGAKSLVLACNTATAAAIKGLREIYPHLPLVGVEPGLKPAAALTQTRIVGVLATERTLSSQKFVQLRQQISAATQVQFLPQAGIGLVDLIEKGALDTPETAALIHRYVVPLLKLGADTLVLGCTHYPFLQSLIDSCILQTAKRRIAIIDTGDAVARQLMRLLAQHGLQRQQENIGTVQAFTTANAKIFTDAFAKLLKIQTKVTEIEVDHQLFLT